MVWRFQASGAARSSTAPQEEGDTGRQLVRYILWVMLYTFCIFGVLRADLFLLKAMVGAEAGGAELSNQVAGVYGAVQYVARLPFQAVIAVTFVVFPMLSRATFSQDHEATRAYIGTTLRYSLILVSLLSAVIAGNARDIVLALYGEAYLDGVLALMVLGVATVGYALFYIATTMITGSGKPEVSAGVAAGTLLVTVGLNAALIHSQVTGQISQGALCMAASAATAVAMVVGFGMALVYLRGRYQARLGWLTVGRVLLACLAVVGFLQVAQAPEGTGRVLLLGWVVGKSALAGALFLVLLWLTREFGVQDKDRLMRVFRRREAGGAA
jgi:O-antigen/teichoic acid export membrane protein